MFIQNDLNTKTQEDFGFVSAQFLGIIAITLFFLAGIVQILFIEYSRQAALTAANEAARAGAQSIDFKRAIEAQYSSDISSQEEADILLAEAEFQCEERLELAATDLLGVSVDEDIDANCDVTTNNPADPPNATRFFMEANFSADPEIFIFWVEPFSSRLSDLTAVYEQRLAAQ